MASECVVTFSVGRLRDLLIEEGKYLQALGNPVEELKDSLTQMEELLEDAEIRQDKRTPEIAKLSDVLRDDIEMYALNVSTKIIGFREGILRRPKVLTKIQKLTTKLEDLVSSKMSKSGNKKEDEKQNIWIPRQQIRDFSHYDADDFVGREEDVKRLVSCLVGSKGKIDCSVISICGMGGLGKTSLAKKVYKSKDVRCHFDGFAFACVTQDCQTGIIFQQILHELVPDKKEEIVKMGEAEIIGCLQRVLKEKRCLVVLDDIWSVDAWKNLSSSVFQDMEAGSKIILTTRFVEVAEVSGFCYPLSCLSDEESWELFRRKAFPWDSRRDFLVHTRMEKLGRTMLRWCQGLPLAVLVLRGILVTKPTLNEWERVYERRRGDMKKLLHQEVEDVLLLSYSELPYQLKPCFLYFGNFLEDHEVNVMKLYHLWIAEGMVLSKDKKEGETMMDVAERYMGEMVQRSMVQVKLEEVPTRGKFKSFLLHDLMRELCLSIVKKEEFLKVTDFRSSESKLGAGCSSSWIGDTKISRNAIYLDTDVNRYVHPEPDSAKNIRSLLFLNYYVGEYLSVECPPKLTDLKNFKLLRVLDLEKVGFLKAKMTKDIQELVHLRYLGLNRCSYIKSLPSSMGNLHYLETLDLRVANIEIPNILWKLERLKHLLFPHSMKMRKSSKLRLDGLNQLETLINFNTNLFYAKDLIPLTNLRKLRVCTETGWTVDFRDLEVIINHLSISNTSCLLLSLNIGNLASDLMPWLFRILPGCEMIISELSLNKVEVENNHMKTLEKLPALQKLSLRNVEFQWEKMVNSAAGFLQLRSLYIFRLNIKQWRVDEGAMPNLSLLKISECKKLEMLPDGLKYIKSLQRLSIFAMPEAFTTRLRVAADGKGGEDLYKVQHVPSITFSKY